MLDVFRRASKGWTAKILMGLLVLSFGIWGIADVFRGFTTGALATVGGRKISVDEAQRLYQQRLRYYSEQSGKAITPEEARKLGLDRLVLAELLRDAALDSEASNMKLAISDAQIADLRKWVLDLEDFAGKPSASNEEHLAAIQKAWHEEWKLEYGDD